MPKPLRFLSHLMPALCSALLLFLPGQVLGQTAAAPAPDSKTVTKVTPATTTYPSSVSLSASPNPVTYGQTVTFTANVTTQCTGSGAGGVTFYDGSSSIGGGPLSGGSVQLPKNNLAAGPHTITAQYSGGGSQFVQCQPATSSALNETVNKATATVTLSNMSQTYTGSALTPTATTSPSGLSIAWTNAPDTNAGNYSVTATVNNANYTGSASGTFTINPARATVLLGSLSQTYNGSALTPTATTSPSGLSIAWTNAPDTNAGNYSVTATVNNANYSGSASGTFTISAVPLSITASSGTMTYGGTVPTITPSYTGFVNGQTASNLTTQPACSTTATSTSNVGTYSSSCSGAVDSNYTITYQNGSVSVTAAPLSITASSGSMTYGGTVPTITPSYTGFVNGQTASSLSTQPACSTTATSSSPVGSYSSSCSGAVDSNYTITYHNGSVSVTAVPNTFSLTGSLNTARVIHTATLLDNGQVLIAGGLANINNNGSALASAELYAPAAGTFTPTGSLNTARGCHTATLLENGQVLIAAGCSANGALASAELYSPAAGTFTATGSLNVARGMPTATLLDNGQVLITGGVDTYDNSLASAELYNPVTGTFTLTGSMNTSRVWHTATLLNDGQVLITGGWNSTSGLLASAELYNPATGTFALTASMGVAVNAQTATLLNGGNVLVAGGWGNSADVATAVLYNPAAGTFTSTGPLNTARDTFTATLLNNGTVLIAGGEAGDGSPILATAEIYDPVAGTFTLTGSMSAARLEPTATLLNNGTVLVAGGCCSSSGNPLNSAELYQSSTLTLVSIAVSPQNPSVAIGGALQMVATGTFSNNSTQTLDSVTWSSSNTSVATISNDAGNLGNAYGVAVGSATLSACAGSVCGSVNFKVNGSGAPVSSSTTVGSSLNPATYRRLVTFTATVGGSGNGPTPTGDVTFYNGSTAMGTVTLASGSAALPPVLLPVGSYSITISYSGDSNYPASTSGVLTQVVNPPTAPLPPNCSPQ